MKNPYKAQHKTDLTEYSDQELSLLVFNDESLYNERHKRGFLNLIEELYIYTDEQMDVLKIDLVADDEEN